LAALNESNNALTCGFQQWTSGTSFGNFSERLETNSTLQVGKIITEEDHDEASLPAVFSNDPLVAPDSQSLISHQNTLLMGTIPLIRTFKASREATIGILNSKSSTNLSLLI
jgi:hypothetical protein